MSLTRKAATAVLGLALLAPLAACDLTGGGSGGQVEYEGEDCDAEDFANREADCGFTKKKTPKPKPPVVKPPVVKYPPKPPVPVVKRR